MSIEYMCCFIRKENCIKMNWRPKRVACLLLYSRKVFLITLQPTFQEVGGVT